MNIPEGWKLVPVEPTEEMYAQFLGYDGTQYTNAFDKEHFIEDWERMLAAAPTPPAPSFAPGSWAPVQAAIDEYLEDYELNDGMEAYHVPTEEESLLIADAVQGLLGNEKFCAEIRNLRMQAQEYNFSSEDLPLPEDKAIQAAHPLKTRRFDVYDEAVRLVSAKHSKYALVDLVNWLLSRIAQAQEDEPVGFISQYGLNLIKERSNTSTTVSVTFERQGAHTIPLYTRPDDRLRRAAEEAYEILKAYLDDYGGDDCEYMTLENLRAALEEK